MPSDVVSALSELADDLDAALFHDGVEAMLASLGFVCEREVWIPDRGDGRGGRLDLVATRDGVRFAFELDDRTPRQKSIQKLVAAAADYRVIVLRCPAEYPLGHSPPPPPGIDAVIGAGRRPAVPEVITKPTKHDNKLWAVALSQLAASGISAGNLEQLRALVLLGRGPDGGLRLRAPPGQGAAKFSRQLVAALGQAGEPAETALHVTIVEGA